MKLSAITTVVAVLMTGVEAVGQIPSEVVDAAIEPRLGGSVMLTACPQHTYKHRLRLEAVERTTEGNTHTYTGKIVNVLKWDRDNYMTFRITIRETELPQIEILRVVERRLFPKPKDVLRKLVREAAKEAIVAAFASDLDERAKTEKAAEARFCGMNEKDWKTPSQALISAIAARLYAEQKAQATQ